MTDLKILSGGAAQGLVTRLTPTFKKISGADISGEFGAVGAMASKLRDGTPADIVMLTAALIAELAQQGYVAGEAFNVGKVETAVAIRTGDAAITVMNADDLRKAFLDADEIYVPDTQTSTAGIHVAKVLAKLGIAEKVAERLKVFPNGTTAMGKLAVSNAKHPIGCTQATEILNTSGVQLMGALPQGYDLATTYTAAVASRASNAKAAQQLIDLLVDPQYRDLRTQLGFGDV
jgi:molybdate transport system substrate-binding protein